MSFWPPRKFIVMWLVAIIIPSTVTAATPDAGLLKREQELLQRGDSSLPPSLKSSTEDHTATSEASSESPQFLVKKITVTGVVRLDPALIERELASYTGREVTLAELNQAASKITSLYARYGYLARTMIPQQDVTSGDVRIVVIEARFGKVKVEKGEGVRISSLRAASYIEDSQATGALVNNEALQRSLGLLRNLSGIRTSAMIEKGTEYSDVDLRLRLEKEPLFNFSAAYDNYGGRTTGYDRCTIKLVTNSPLRLGDRLALVGTYSDGLRYLKAMYSLPVGTDGLIVGAGLSGLSYKLGADFKALDLTGSALTVSTFATYPVVVTDNSLVNFHAAYEYGMLKDKMLDVSVGDKIVWQSSFGFGGAWYDRILGGGYTIADITLGHGHVDLTKLPIVAALDRLGPGTGDYFEKLSLTYSRFHPLIDRQLALYVSASGQLATHNLDTSEKFSLGGPNGVRAYASAEGTGDQGVVLSAELRHQVSRSCQLFWFYDYGLIQQYLHPWSGWNSQTPDLPNTYSLDAVGLGVLLQPFDRFSIKGTVATRLRDNPAADTQGNDHDGIKRDPRFWLESALVF